MNSLLQFMKSISGPLLTGYFTLIGAIIGAAGAIFGIWLLLRYYKGKEERERKSLLKAVYNALKSEIETNKKYFEYGVGKKLEETDGLIFERGVFDFEYDIMYKANAQIICYIPNIELIKAIVRLYGLWGGLKDAIRKHSAEVEKYKNLEMASERLGVKKHQLQQIEKSIIILTTMMQSCYAEIKLQTELVLQKLNTQIDLQ